MDKYQNYLMVKSNDFACCFQYEYQGKNKRISCNIEDKIVVTQEEDIFFARYPLQFLGRTLSKVYAYKNNKWVLLKKPENPIYTDIPSFEAVLDFSDRIKKIKICFVNGLADDLIIPVEYVEADKEEYYKKEREKNLEKLKNALSLKVNTGSNLVNICWKLANDEIEKVKIDLYVGYGKNKQLMANYILDNTVFYKSISELAYGYYCFVLKQINKNGEVVIETDFIEFNIVAKCNSIKPNIVWH